MVRNFKENFDPEYCEIKNDKLMCMENKVEKELVVEVEGQRPTKGKIFFKDGDVYSVVKIQFGDKVYNKPKSGDLVEINKPCTTPNPGDTTFVDGQYKYEKIGVYSNLYKEGEDGWAVRLMDYASTDPVTTKLCTTINGEPIVSMEVMFAESQASSIDLSSFDTSNVRSMFGMFYKSKATTLDLSSFDTSKVENMVIMFWDSAATTLDLSNFNTSSLRSVEGMLAGFIEKNIDTSNFSYASDFSNIYYAFK